MSLILDALKRSEQTDSTISHVRADAHQSAGVMRLRPLVAALLLAALLGVGVATWFSRVSPDDAASPSLSASPLGPMDSNQPGSPAADDQPKRLNRSSTEPVLSARAESRLVTDPSMRGMAAASSGALSPSRLVDAGPTETTRAVVELNAQMWSDSESADVEAPDRASVVAPDGAPETGGGEPEAPQLPETRNSPGEVANLGTIAPPINLEKAIAEAANAVGERSLVPHAATMIENLSQQQKDDIPTLIYSAHEFKTDGSAAVELNGQRLKVGQRAGPLVIKDILVDSVILENSGVTFRLTALNSWVNM
ncbi:general secretion pathway protein GspB [Luminiphilus sp.]|nr:general secretion pathway protein GspB [Luminiphilus sp.]